VLGVTSLIQPRCPHAKAVALVRVDLVPIAEDSISQALKTRLTRGSRGV
jgi:hypothetical protein